MRFKKTDAFEGVLFFRGIVCECYFLSDSEIELIIKKYEDNLTVRTLYKFFRKVKKKFEKKGYTDISVVSYADSVLNELYKRTAGLEFSTTEYMLVLPACAMRFTPTAEIVKKEIGDESAEESTGGRDNDKDKDNCSDTDADCTCILSKEPGVFRCFVKDYLDGKYIYDVFVKENLRNLGYGTKYMKRVLFEYSDYNIYIQVSGQNTAAMALYKKLGFEVKEELWYHKI